MAQWPYEQHGAENATSSSSTTTTTTTDQEEEDRKAEIQRLKTYYTDVSLMFPLDENYVASRGGIIPSSSSSECGAAAGAAAPTAPAAVVLDPSTGLSIADLEDMRQVCVEIASIRCQVDLIHAICTGPETEQVRFWYSIMARCLLRLMMVFPAELPQNSVTLSLVQLLFDISSVGDEKTLPAPFHYPDEVTYHKVFFSLGTALNRLYTYATNDNEPFGTGAEPHERYTRCVIARRALFFICLHFDVAFLECLLDPASNAPFINLVGFIDFFTSGLQIPISMFINENTIGVPLFVTDCFCTYVFKTSVNPFEKEYGGTTALPIYQNEWLEYIKYRNKEYKEKLKRGRSSGGGGAGGCAPPTRTATTATAGTEGPHSSSASDRIIKQHSFFSDNGSAVPPGQPPPPHYAHHHHQTASSTAAAANSAENADLRRMAHLTRVFEENASSYNTEAMTAGGGGTSASAAAGGILSSSSNRKPGRGGAESEMIVGYTNHIDIK